MEKTLQKRIKELTARLAAHGITKYKISSLLYLNADEESFATPYEAACRMMILYGVSYTAANPSDAKKVANWLKQESLWQFVSPNEQKLFAGKIKGQQKLIDLSWEGEASYILAWALSIIKQSPSPTEQVNEEQIEEFTNAIPFYKNNIGNFLKSLSFRNREEILDENQFHELATSFFRDLLFTGEKDTTDIDRGVSFKRHKALNWLRRFGNISEWDETSTST